MRLPLFVLLTLVPAAMTAEPAGASESADGPAWLPILLTAITLGIGWLANLLRKKLNVTGETAQLDANKSLMEQKNFIIDKRLIPFALNTAEHWLTLTLPRLIKDATDGDGFRWGDHWDDLRSYLKKRVVAKFLAENVDIVALLGERELDNLLDRLAVRMIAHLPENVQRFLPEEVIDKLTDKASELLVEKGSDLLSKHIDLPDSKDS